LVAIQSTIPESTIVDNAPRSPLALSALPRYLVLAIMRETAITNDILLVVHAGKEEGAELV
jgi:hypothetical protein